MKYVVNSREMKLYDKNTTERFFIPSVVLMERAAVSLVGELKSRGVDLSNVLIVCGVGNNGGDGLAAARLLKLEGRRVTVVLCKDKKKASEENLHQQKILAAYGFETEEDFSPELPYTAVIDALFGVGLSRNIEGAYAGLIEKMNAASGKKIAVDIASGISSDNGAVLGTAFRAELTVTFAYAKVGMLLWPGNEYSGQIVIKEIGINERSFSERKPAAAFLEKEDLKRLPERKSHSNKGTYGKLLVIAGSVNMAGAAYLCAKAAYAAGCGLVRIVTPEENRIILQTKLPEAILTTYRSVKPDTAGWIEAINWADAIVCGPGIGVSDTAAALVKCVLKNASTPVLFDADALNLIAQDVSVLLRPHTELVVTPHVGEMSRLTGDLVSYLQTRLIETAEEFARQYNVVCVLKDEHTVTSVPYRQTYLNLSGNHGMATAGSGDVLSGIIGSLMAQRMQAEEAAPLGVYLHGLSGEVMAEKSSMRGLMASDLADGVRFVLRDAEKNEIGADMQGNEGENEQV